MGISEVIIQHMIPSASGFSASNGSVLNYHLLTRSTVQVLAQVGLNEVQTDARVSVLSAGSSGRTMQVEQLAFRPRAQDPTTLLLAELNTLQKCLVLSTDAYGELTGLRNHADVEAPGPSCGPACCGSSGKYLAWSRC